MMERPGDSLLVVAHSDVAVAYSDLVAYQLFRVHFTPVIFAIILDV
jgi:hypothetical protein